MTWLGKLILSLWMGISLSSLSAQTYLNAIYRHDAPGHIFTESVWYNDTLYVFGTGFYPDQRRATISKYNVFGHLIELFKVPDTSDEYRFGFWSRGAMIQNDTIFHTAAKQFGNGIARSSMMKLSLTSELWLEEEFKSINFPTIDFCRIRDFIKHSNGFILIEESSRGENDDQICITSTDHLYNIIWRKTYGNNSREWPFDILVLPNGNIVGVGFSNNMDGTGYVDRPGIGYYDSYVIEVDPSGNLIREWRSDDTPEAAWAAHAVNDSILVIASSIGEELCGGLCRFIFEGKAMMINLHSGQKLWETPLRVGQTANWYESRYPDIIPSIEGDGYILCGGGYYSIPDCRIDTVDKCWATPGVIAKVSNTGDSLWMRKYFGVYNISEANMLLDAEIVPDSSGYSFVGEAFTGWPGETQGQHGWLLMTDVHGCLVPGCHLISSDESSPPPDSGEPVMKIHPNPVTDFLNILITRSLDADATLSLISMNGTVLDQWTTFETGATYIIPTTPYPSGMYVLSMTSKGKVLDQQKVIIQ